MGRKLAAAAGTALFGPGEPPGPWLDPQGSAAAVGYTAFGRREMLQLMEPIRSQPPFTGQLTFGEDQLRYQHELQLAQEAAGADGVLDHDIHLLQTAAAERPQDGGLQLALAAALQQANRPADALAAIDGALGLEPRSADLLVRRARALLALHRGPAAEASVREALRLDPFDLPAFTALVEVLRATGDYEAGQSSFAAAIREHPGSGLIRLSYADLLFFHGARDQAVAECRSVLQQEPASADALRRLVSLTTAEGKAAEVQALMEAARLTQPLNFENDLGLARLYDGRGDTAKAAECLADAARGGPATAQVHVYLARNLSRLGRPQDALLELARARRAALLTDDADLAAKVEETIRKVGGEPASR